MIKDVEKMYAREVGETALERQKRHADNCSYCWSAPGEPHTSLCPNRPEEEEAAILTQEEGLF